MDTRLCGCIKNMKNIPRIYINEKLESGKIITIPKEQLHYLQKVMRTQDCLIFNSGQEFTAQIINNQLSILDLTKHLDPANNLILAFAPIKKTEELINMATQMGVAKFLPVITDYTNARHINWERIKKISIEASEQSGRNSVPEILPEIKFAEFVKTNKNIIFADERFARCENPISKPITNCKILLIGPEGGFSNTEFETLDNTGGIGLDLGKTILRAEVAAIAAIAKTEHR